MIRIKRVYEPAVASDGHRVLVDRLWPRGMPKAAAGMDEWLREVAPSHGLRRWYSQRWDEFCIRYFKELEAKPELVWHLRRMAKRRTVTLLFGARETEHNNAAALKIFLDCCASRKPASSRVPKAPTSGTKAKSKGRDRRTA